VDFWCEKLVRINFETPDTGTAAGGGGGMTSGKIDGKQLIANAATCRKKRIASNFELRATPRSMCFL